jgi:hypothetical protein
MRKVFALVVLVAAAAIPVTAYAADLHNGQGTTCAGTGTYHFVLNQAPGDAGSQTLTVNGVNYGTPDMTVAGGKVGHWTVEFSGTLNTASTSGAGMLVLSDSSCKKGGGGGGK